jgi:hypothetical protein
MLMKKFKFLSASSTVFSLILSTFSQVLLAENNFENSANVLMSNLKTKVSASLAFAEKTPLMPSEDPRLFMQCLSDEFQFQDIHHDVFLEWQKNWKKNKKHGLEKLTTNDFVSQDFSKLNIKKTIEFDGISQVVFESQAKLVSKEEGLKSLNYLIGNFNSVEFVELTTEKYLSIPSKRMALQKMNQATLWLRFDIRGTGEKAKRLQERGVFKVNVSLLNNKWKISKLELLEIEQLQTDQVLFENITKISSVQNLVPKYLRREAIRRGGYAMAIGDVNKDNKKDIFVATAGETVLLNGMDNLTYSLSEQKSLNKQTLVKSAAFADFSNSGSEDLLLVRFAPNESQTKDDRSDIQIYKNDQGKLQRREKIINFNVETDYAMPLALADFNNDGFLDFYVGFPGAKDFTTLSPAIHNKDLASQGVFYNEAGAKFKDDPYKNFTSNRKESDELSKIFPHSALAVDFNQDNNMDLIVIDDRGNLSPFYLNKGNGQFEASSQKIGVGLMDFGMGVDAADLNADGKVDFAMSSVNFNASRRIKESCAINWSVESAIVAGTSGLRTFTAAENGTFTETTSANGLNFTGEGAGGVKIFDYNNDGLPDIYLTAGLWSGKENDNSQDISHYFIAASMLGILESELKSSLRSKGPILYKKPLLNEELAALEFRSDSQSAMMDLLSYYRGDLRGEKNKKSSLSFAGNQPNRMFRNNGNGTYTEVGYLLGVDSIADGYMAATMDMNNDGNLDLVLRNADPGYSLDQFSPVEVFKNAGILKNKSVTIKLIGTRSNINAIGAKLVATIGDRKIVEQAMGSSGTVQSERILHFGLGKNTQIDNLEIRWPRGIVQSLKDVKAGYHIINEPGVEVSSTH